MKKEYQHATYQRFPASASSISCSVGASVLDLRREYIDITNPGVQKPHCEPCAFASRSWIGCKPSLGLPIPAVEFECITIRILHLNIQVSGYVWLSVSLRSLPWRLMSCNQEVPTMMLEFPKRGIQMLQICGLRLELDQTVDLEAKVHMINRTVQGHLLELCRSYGCLLHVTQDAWA